MNEEDILGLTEKAKKRKEISAQIAAIYLTIEDHVKSINYMKRLQRGEITISGRPIEKITAANGIVSLNTKWFDSTELIEDAIIATLAREIAIQEKKAQALKEEL